MDVHITVVLTDGVNARKSSCIDKFVKDRPFSNIGHENSMLERFFLFEKR